MSVDDSNDLNSNPATSNRVESQRQQMKQCYSHCQYLEKKPVNQTWRARHTVWCSFDHCGFLGWAWLVDDLDDCQCKLCNNPKCKPCNLQQSGIWEAADETMLSSLSVPIKKPVNQTWGAWHTFVAVLSSKNQVLVFLVWFDMIWLKILLFSLESIVHFEQY